MDAPRSALENTLSNLFPYQEYIQLNKNGLWIMLTWRCDILSDYTRRHPSGLYWHRIEPILLSWFSTGSPDAAPVDWYSKNYVQQKLFRPTLCVKKDDIPNSSTMAQIPCEIKWASHAIAAVAQTRLQKFDKYGFGETQWLTILWTCEDARTVASIDLGASIHQLTSCRTW